MTLGEEEKAQLIVGAVLAVVLALPFIGKSWLGASTLFGMPLSDLTSVMAVGLMAIAILWRCVWPPRSRRETWYVAVYALFWALILVLRVEGHWPLARIVANASVATIVVLTAGSLFMFARLIRGIR
jgi:hypothetical protein